MAILLANPTSYSPIKRKVNDAEELNFGAQKSSIDYSKMGLA